MKRWRVCHTGKLLNNLPDQGEEEQTLKRDGGRQQQFAARGGWLFLQRCVVICKNVIHSLNMILKLVRKFN